MDRGGAVPPELHAHEQREEHHSSAYLSRVSTHSLAVVVTYAFLNISSIADPFQHSISIACVEQGHILHTRRPLPEVATSLVFRLVEYDDEERLQENKGCSR
jgi:hypothetical protein